MMTGGLGANAVWSFEGVDLAVNIEETCQQSVETQNWAVISIRTPKALLKDHTITGGLVTGQGSRRGPGQTTRSHSVVPRSQE